MTKEQWHDIFLEEAMKHIHRQNDGSLSQGSGPEGYAYFRKCYDNFLDNMEEATKVYFMENKKK